MSGAAFWLCKDSCHASGNITQNEISYNHMQESYSDQYKFDASQIK